MSNPILGNFVMMLIPNFDGVGSEDHVAIYKL